MSPDLKIVDFEARFQPGFDQLHASIQNEYPENIYAPGSPKMKDVAGMQGRRYWVTCMMIV